MPSSWLRAPSVSHDLHLRGPAAANQSVWPPQLQYRRRREGKCETVRICEKAFIARAAMAGASGPRFAHIPVFELHHATRHVLPAGKAEAGHGYDPQLFSSHLQKVPLNEFKDAGSFHGGTGGQLELAEQESLVSSGRNEVGRRRAK